MNEKLWPGGLAGRWWSAAVFAALAGIAAASCEMSTHDVIPLVEWSMLTSAPDHLDDAVADVAIFDDGRVRFGPRLANGQVYWRQLSQNVLVELAPNCLRRRADSGNRNCRAGIRGTRCGSAAAPSHHLVGSRGHRSTRDGCRHHRTASDRCSPGARDPLLRSRRRCATLRGGGGVAAPPRIELQILSLVDTLLSHTG